MLQDKSRSLLGSALAVGLLTWLGCDSASNEPPAANVVNVPVPAGPGGPPAPGGEGPGGPGGPGGGRNSPIRAVMRKIDDRRPGGLTKAIVDGLKPDQPDWPALQKQAGEYVQATTELAKLDPPRGSKESWDKLTSAFHESAADLEKAAIAKKRDDAVAAGTHLSNSCMECHREHRRMPGGGPGRGGFGPRPGGGPPPGGMPPGGGPPPGDAPPPGGGPPPGGAPGPR